ncbi:aldehyde dehydrogenase [Sesbania bispinosa]|nr:aldehyde dehydrogenase [Sesbania bispinosa]
MAGLLITGFYPMNSKKTFKSVSKTEKRNLPKCNAMYGDKEDNDISVSVTTQVYQLGTRSPTCLRVRSLYSLAKSN